MSLYAVVLLFFLGLGLIIKGGDWFLDGAVWIAEATGVPRFIVGATVVSIATTLPELTVSITGVLEEKWIWPWATRWAPSRPISV